MLAWLAGCRDRERRPAEPGAAAGERRSRRPGMAVESPRSRRLASWGCPWSRGWPVAGIASDGRRNLAPLPASGDQDARERLLSFTDRGAWLREVGRGRVVGRPAAGIASECRRLNLAPLPAGGDRGAEFARARAPDSALAGGFPGSRATAGGTWRRYRQVAIEPPGLPDLTGQRLAAMIAIGRPRERLLSFTDRGAWLHGVARGRVFGGALAGRLPGSRASAGG